MTNTLHTETMRCDGLGRTCLEAIETALKGKRNDACSNPDCFWCSTVGPTWYDSHHRYVLYQQARSARTCNHRCDESDRPCIGRTDEPVERVGRVKCHPWSVPVAFRRDLSVTGRPSHVLAARLAHTGLVACRRRCSIPGNRPPIRRSNHRVRCCHSLFPGGRTCALEQHAFAKCAQINGISGGEMINKEQESGKTILAIFRAIEERDAAQFRALLQPDFEIHWPRSLPYGGTFRGVERSLVAGAQPGSPCSRPNRKERWTPESSLPKAMTW